MQSAFLCAFVDPSLSAERDRIRHFTSMDDVLGFCRSQGDPRLYFIVDQINALEHEDVNTDTIQNDRKDALATYLQKIYLGHYSITSASANYRTALHMGRKQTGELKMSMMGGMSEVSLLFISFI